MPEFPDHQAAEAELAATREELQQVRRERNLYHDALIARHGGEPVALLAELDEARERAEKAERDVEQEIANRDEMEERINRIAAALDLSEKAREWSNMNDPADRCIERIDELQRELAEARGACAWLLKAQASDARRHFAADRLRRIRRRTAAR